VKIAGSFSEDIKSASSRLREIFGIREAIKTAYTYIGKGELTIEIKTDSQAGEKILKKGFSKVGQINDMMKKIWWECRTKGVRIDANWISRSENKEADYLSRLVLPMKREDIILATKWAEANKLSIISFDFSTGKIRSDQIRIIKPNENFIAGIVHISKVNRARIAIIHPKWEAQSWWPYILKSEQTNHFGGQNWISLLDFQNEKS